MSYEEAREQARFLSDKMAYELNLNDQQYNDAYEINLDYLMSLNTADDIAGPYLDWRAADLRAILYDWQWSLFIGADYFLRPVLWRAGAWFYPIFTFTIVADTDTHTSTITASMPIVVPTGMEDCVEVIEVP